MASEDAHDAIQLFLHVSSTEQRLNNEHQLKNTSVCVSHRNRRRSWRRRGRRRRHLCHPRLHVILEGGDVALFLYDDAERRPQRNVPSSLRHQDFSQITFLLHLEACEETFGL